MIVVFFIWILNFVISWWNAYSCGKVWVETKSAGGWPRFMTWMGAVMAASGFSWCFLIFLALGAHQFWPQTMTDRATNVCVELGYIVIIPGVLFSGLMITVDSWIQTWRNKCLTNFGISAYNTYAQIHNTYEAINGLGPAFEDVLSFFKGNDDDDSSAQVVLLVITLVLIAVCGGVILTAAIIKKYAGTVPLPSPRGADL